MQSVTSNAVAKVLETVDSWSSSGVSVYRIGKIVSLHFYAQISSSTRYTIVTIPERFRPSFNVRFVFLKNSTDDPYGQAVLETDGKLTLWAKNGSGFNDSYGGTVSYIL